MGGMATEVEEDDDRELDDWTEVVDGGGGERSSNR